MFDNVTLYCYSVNIDWISTPWQAPGCVLTGILLICYECASGKERQARTNEAIISCNYKACLDGKVPGDWKAYSIEDANLVWLTFSSTPRSGWILWTQEGFNKCWMGSSIARGVRCLSVLAFGLFDSLYIYSCSPQIITLCCQRARERGRERVLCVFLLKTTESQMTFWNGI